MDRFRLLGWAPSRRALRTCAGHELFCEDLDITHARCLSARDAYLPKR
jgi:hypothetical protein